MKKILILYVNNGDVRNISKVELMWNKVMQWLQEKEQKEIEKIKYSWDNRIDRKATFKDGTTVEVIPVGNQIIGKQATHIFIADDIYNLQNGDEFVVRQVIPRIISDSSNYNSNYKEKMERLFVFRFNDNNEVVLENFTLDKRNKQ